MRTNRSMPRCRVVPVITYDDVPAAIEWLSRTFGFTERWRVGGHRAQLSVGDGAAVAIAQRRTDGSGASVMVRVEDVDAHHDRAARAGAEIIEPPADYPYGERQYTVRDLAGHAWTFSQSIANVAPEAWGGTSATLD